MNWRLWTWNDLAGVALMALVTGGMFYFTVLVPHSKVKPGFGLEWDCVNQKSGLPVCTKRPTNIPKPS